MPEDPGVVKGISSVIVPPLLLVDRGEISISYPFQPLKRERLKWLKRLVESVSHQPGEWTVTVLADVSSALHVRVEGVKLTWALISIIEKSTAIILKRIRFMWSAAK